MSDNDDGYIWGADLADEANASRWDSSWYSLCDDADNLCEYMCDCSDEFRAGATDGFNDTIQIR